MIFEARSQAPLGQELLNDLQKTPLGVSDRVAVLNQEIGREAMAGFVQAHGMPGFSPTQGHIASAVPFLGHAVDRIKDGRMDRAMFMAKGSLFLGRMTQMSDGVSFILEANPGG